MKGLKHQCYGGCNSDEDGMCINTPIYLVEVSGNGIIAPWKFYYCEEAIKADEKNGFRITKIKE